jgi:hypothetical protein
LQEGIYKPKNEYTNDRLGPFEIRWLGYIRILTIIREDENKHNRVLTITLTDLYDNICRERNKRRNRGKTVV